MSANPTTVTVLFAPMTGPPAHTLPAPFVEILTPAPNVFLDLPAVTVTGDIQVSTLPFEFCLVVNSRDLPDACDQYGTVSQASYPFTFSIPVSAGLHPGFNTITAWVVQGDGQESSWFVNVEVAAPTNGIDLRTVTIETTQGSQFYGLPFPPESTSSSSTREATYNGVRLARGGKTVARVYADAISTGRPGHLVSGARMLLYGYRSSSHALLAGRPAAPGRRAADARDRAVESRSARDALGPPRRLHVRHPGQLDAGSEHRTARAGQPARAGPAIPECPGCSANNTFRLLGVNFVGADSYDIFPVKLTWTDSDHRLRWPPADGTEVFATAATMTPAAQDGFRVHPYAGQVDVTASARPTASEDDRNGELLGALFQWQYWNTHSGMVLGVNVDLARGLTAPALLPAPIFASDIAIVASQRPKTSVAHEFWHMLGTVHASTCSRGDATGAAEPWPPDQAGYLEGYGLDRRGVAGSGGPYAIMGELPASPWYDFMSYCALDSNAWISTRNWDRRLRGGGEQTGLSVQPRSRIAVGPTLEVTGLVETTGRCACSTSAREARRRSRPTRRRRGR